MDLTEVCLLLILLCSSDECAVKLRECIIGLGVGICDGDEFCVRIIPGF